MNSPTSKLMILIVSTVLSLTAFGTGVYAMGNGSENTALASPQATAPIYREAAVPLTPEGNLTLVDDIQQTDDSEKQFVTLKTKAGNTFYLVIDRTGKQENVYFMNLVDEADLMALVDKDTLDDTPLTGGSVLPEPRPDPATLTEAEATSDAEAPERKSFNMLPMMILLVLAFSGGALWFFKFRSSKSSVKGRTDLDTYNFNDDDEDDYVADDEDGIDPKDLERDPE